MITNKHMDRRIIFLFLRVVILLFTCVLLFLSYSYAHAQRVYGSVGRSSSIYLRSFPIFVSIPDSVLVAKSAPLASPAPVPIIASVLSPFEFATPIMLPVPIRVPISASSLGSASKAATPINSHLGSGSNLPVPVRLLAQNGQQLQSSLAAPNFIPALSLGAATKPQPSTGGQTSTKAAVQTNTTAGFSNPSSRPAIFQNTTVQNSDTTKKSSKVESTIAQLPITTSTIAFMQTSTIDTLVQPIDTPLLAPIGKPDTKLANKQNTGDYSHKTVDSTLLSATFVQHSTVSIDKLVGQAPPAQLTSEPTTTKSSLDVPVIGLIETDDDSKRGLHKRGRPTHKTLGAMDSKLIFTMQTDESQYYTYFKSGSSTIDVNFMNNANERDRMESFIGGLIERKYVIIDSIVVYGAASPEGDLHRNKALAIERCNSVKRYIARAFLRLDERKIITYSKGEDWEGLKSAVINDPNVPNRAEVLDVLNTTVTRENREFFLRRLKDGSSWRYISTEILPYLRSGVSAKVYYSEDPLQYGHLVESSTIALPEIATKIAKDTVLRAVMDTIKVPIYKTLTVNRPLWSVKTNLLYWAALQPNIEAEFYFANNWSLNFEYQVAWWKNEEKHQYYQYTQCGPEGRYWFNGDGNFNGHYIGLHVGFGIYDLSWGNAPDYQGYQGEFAIALGLTYGYTWKLGKQLHLEAGFGFGYIMTEYRRYRVVDECYVYQGTERMQFLGPTKARLALQWRIGSGVNAGKKKRGGTR